MPHPMDAESSSEGSGDEGNQYDDAEEDVGIDFHAQAQAQAAAMANQSDGDDDDDDDDDHDEAEEVQAFPTAMPQYGGIRGKPEAMAVALAASNIPEVKQELEAEKQDTIMADAAPVVASVVAEPVLDPPGASGSKMAAVDAHATPDPEYSAPPKPKKKKKPAPKKSPSTASKKSPKGKSSASNSSAIAVDLNAPSLDDPMDPITEAEYENLIHLMEHFCKVPLLAEFSRPVTLLHPELMAVYSKIVKHPIDLGKVCRKIGKRQYKNTREVQLDMWRIFTNCVKYHSSPSNKEGVPSFVSIALHLREYWNNLFQEFMLPSEAPKEGTSATAKAGSNAAKFIRDTFATREEDRKKRLIVSGLTCMSPGCLKRSAEKLRQFIANQGRVDSLDKDYIFPGVHSLGPDIDHDDLKDLTIVLEKLKAAMAHLLQLSEDNAEYTVEQFDVELKASYENDVFENNPALKFRVRNRMNRFVGKILVPINEANCRGVTQSSIWGCMAAAIWARESSKKPFWPALVLGILAPDDQKEDWHWALTERNEQRLPEALRTQLTAGKRKAEQALKRQSLGQMDPQSFFLVEFLGTHEFIWVRETDIVESFEPEDDPNLKVQPGKKKRQSHGRNSSLVGSKKYQAAVEEAGWALEEFEMQLQDACGDMGDDEDGEDGNYSYGVLCVSDDEADDVYDDNDELTMSEVEEANELIATRGLIDFSVNGRKNAKKRALALKKQKQEAVEKKKKAEKLKKEKAKKQKMNKERQKEKNKEREEKKEARDVERRRKKRTRERERILKSSARKTSNKRKRGPNEETENEKSKESGALLLDKRARASAIVRGYLTRMAEDKEYRSLGLQGVMSIPAAMVDSSGLLGMALAFRAAAGEINMPEESGDHEQTKPWDAIEIDENMSESERTAALRKQAELLEDEIKRVRSATQTRLHLAEEAERARKQLDIEIFKEEELARANPYAKRPTAKKKATPGSASKGTGGSPAGASDAGKEEDAGEDATEETEKGAAMDTEESTINLGPSHVAETPPRETTVQAIDTSSSHE